MLSHSQKTGLPALPSTVSQSPGCSILCIRTSDLSYMADAHMCTFQAPQPLKLQASQYRRPQTAVTLWAYMLHSRLCGCSNHAYASGHHRHHQLPPPLPQKTALKWKTLPRGFPLDMTHPIREKEVRRSHQLLPPKTATAFPATADTCYLYRHWLQLMELKVDYTTGPFWELEPLHSNHLAPLHLPTGKGLCPLKPVYKVWKRWLLYQMHRHQHKVQETGKIKEM